MIELADFEYAATVIFDLKADEGFTFATEETDEKNMFLIPVFYAFKFEFPIRWFYSEFINEREPKLPHAQTTFCAMARRDYKLSLFDLNEGQYELLNCLETGVSVSEAKEILCEEANYNKIELERVWPEWKKRWVELGFFFTN